MSDKTIHTLTQEAIALLKQLIATQSFSSEEEGTALLIEAWFNNNNIPFKKENNNIWAYNKNFVTGKPLLLLNSHHDTVKPNQGYTRNPLDPAIEDGKLYGLGSNDAGGCLVSLMASFTYLYEAEDLPYNVVMVASAEEESSGPKGLNSVLKHLPNLELAIVGEPTEMQLAIAEKGLLVLDVTITGTPGHAAHPNDDVSIYNAIPVIEWFRDYRFEHVSDVLGPMKMTVTGINAGKQHNVIPAECSLVVDVRVNDKYTNIEVLEIIRTELAAKFGDKVKVNPRSLHLNSSSIDKEHPLVQAGIELGRTTYGSPTLSDQSVLSCQSLKLGPGLSTRSHSADEYIFVHEIENGIELYIKILSKFLNIKSNKVEEAVAESEQ